MKKIYTIVTLLFMSIAFSQSNLTISQAVNMAGKQRMLSQRLAKDKIFKTINILQKEVNEELNTSVALFEDNLKKLEAYAPTKEIKYKIKIVSLMWNGYKKDIFDESRQSNYSIFATNTYMLTACDDVVKELIAYSKTLPTDANAPAATNTDAEKVAIATSNSGKLRYLSQRFTLYYASYYYKLDTTSTDDLNEILKTFDKTLSALITSNVNNENIDAALTDISKDWIELKKPLLKDQQLVFDFDSDLTNPSATFLICNAILSKADKLTGLYASRNTQ